MRPSIARHLLRYRGSAILDVCSIYASGYLTPLALHPLDKARGLSLSNG